MKFASWAFDGSQVDVTVDESETGAKGDIYKNNTEWELVSVTAERREVSERSWARSSDKTFHGNTKCKSSTSVSSTLRYSTTQRTSATWESFWLNFGIFWQVHGLSK